MAQLQPDFSFIGRLGNITAYKMKGSDKIILRTKGGANKDKIKRAPEFEPVRRNYTEFGGRSTGSRYIREALFPLNQLADYNIAGPISALIQPIQAMDTESEHGKRNIYFTKNPKLLEGFSLNRQNPFDSIVRNPLSYSLDRNNLTARLDIPSLIPGINFFVAPGRNPFYSFVAVLGIVPDVVFDTYRYESVNRMQPWSEAVESEWYPVLKGSPVASLRWELQIPRSELPGTAYSLMLSAGIRFGNVGATGEMQQVKNAGAAKILAVV